MSFQTVRKFSNSAKKCNLLDSKQLKKNIFKKLKTKTSQAEQYSLKKNIKEVFNKF